MTALHFDTTSGCLERPRFALGPAFRDFFDTWGMHPPDELLWFAEKFGGTQLAGGHWQVEQLQPGNDGTLLHRAVRYGHWATVAGALLGAVRIGTYKRQPVWYVLYSQEGLPRRAVVTRSGPWEPPQRLAIGLRAFAGELLHAHAWELEMSTIERPMAESDAGVLMLLGLADTVPEELGDEGFSATAALEYHHDFGLNPVQACVALLRAGFEGDEVTFDEVFCALNDHPSRIVREIAMHVAERRGQGGWLGAMKRRMKLLF